MTKFIKLHEPNKNITVLVNVDEIAYIQSPMKLDGDVYIKLKSLFDGKDKYFFVKEKIEEIEVMLGISVPVLNDKYMSKEEFKLKYPSDSYGKFPPFNVNKV